ncbi:non-ribosomal peptide synthetase [Streptomyces sp. NPDC059076]|uniref:non-ribosomal peptide synthetase n=1 Tax=unclassified Streptomyces TaxID=2593676 RepID=UPI0036AC3750
MSTSLPRTPGTTIDMTTPEGCGLLSVEYGAALKEAPVGRTAILGRYDHWVSTTPQAPAVVTPGHTYTYRELDSLADRVVTLLRGRVGPGDLVAVCLENGVALVALWVAVVRLGAVCLPLGPRPGGRRLKSVLDEVRPACLIGVPGQFPDGLGATLEVADGSTVPLPVPSSVDAGAIGAAAVFLAQGAGPEVPAGALYVVLTSGSTGGPKAVVVGDLSFDALLNWYVNRTDSGPGDRHSMIIGPAFDPHPKEVWAALTSGAALAVPPETVRSDPRALSDWWQQAEVSLSILPTPLGELVLERCWPVLPRLRHVEIGGDRLRRWPSADVTAQVHNAYGPAEATVLTTVHRMDLEQGDTGGPPPIGRPMDGVIVWVTDDAGRVVPRGEAGELRIGGSCLALGYLDERLTALHFVPPPAGVVGVDRVYRTGDRVRMAPDGVLEFLGRLDDQVKVSGVRVELAEVEAALEEFECVARAVVVPHEVSGTTRLVAFVLPSSGGETDPERLRHEMRVWLPEQVVPAQVVNVDAFPLGPNGKVDRRALLAGVAPTARSETPEPLSNVHVALADGRTGAGIGPGTSLENEILSLFRDLLDNPELRLGDNPTDAGMTSLVAAHLLNALENLSGVRLGAPEFLRQPDLLGIVSLVATRVTDTVPRKPGGAPADSDRT